MRFTKQLNYQFNGQAPLQKVVKECNIVQIFCLFWEDKLDIGGQEVDKMTAKMNS